MPVYNQFEAASYKGQNLWHYDLVVRRANEAQENLLTSLIPDRGRHSPIVGLAVDGYPIYGPWAQALLAS